MAKQSVTERLGTDDRIGGPDKQRERLWGVSIEDWLCGWRVLSGRYRYRQSDRG